MINKRLLYILAAIVLASSALYMAAIGQVSAPFTVTVTPAGSSIACDIGPPYIGSIPAAASQAGFTRCAANFDFTQTQSFTDSGGTRQWSNMSTWFSCSYQVSLVYVASDYDAPCDSNHQSIVVDSGVQTFKTTVLKSDQTAGKYFARLNMQPINQPEQSYMEMVIRPDATDVCNNFCTYFDLSTFTNVQGNPCFVATDMEWDGGATSTGVGEAWWNFNCGTGSGFGSCDASQCSTPVEFPINTNVNTYGNLTTMDNVSKVSICDYWAAGAVSGLPSSSFRSCLVNTIVPPSANAVFHTQPLYIYFGENTNGAFADMKVNSMSTYIQRITIWLCQGYQNGSCNTASVVSTAPP